MSVSKSKSSFTIDDILCGVHSSRTNICKPSGSVSSDLTLLDFNKFSNNFLPMYTNSFDISLSRYYFPPPQIPHHRPLSSASYIEHYGSAFQKAPASFLPYYSSPYGGCHLNFKRKGGQVRFTPQQSSLLERRFNIHKYLSPDDRKQLAIQLKLSDRQVKTWFQNRRAKQRRSTVIPTQSSQTKDANKSNAPAPPNLQINSLESPKMNYLTPMEHLVQRNRFTSSTEQPKSPTH